MDPRDGEPDIDWDALVESRDFHRLFSCSREGETRTYNLRVVTRGAELWRVTEAPGEASRSVREAHFTSATEAGRLLEEIRRMLIAGGWVEL